ncbi:MAG: trypsin-like peptidase domain-containing protein [Deltaproteobacteria bacterium]|nr:trypsin-like peptidase domain-containing protein [Deltaproteobacteria bacterium]
MPLSLVHIATVLAAGACFLGAAPAGAAEPPPWTTLGRGPASHVTPFADLADRARPAVVHVRGIAPEDSASGKKTPESDRVSIGTGFIINKDGTIVTNDHVVRNVTRLRVRLYNGEELTACVLGSDAATDIALLKVEPINPLPVLPLGDSDRVRVGEPVIAIGNPFGFNNSVTAGIISAKERVVDRAVINSPAGADSYSFFIQTDASINLGNSGGPLIDRHGQVIGISAAFWAGHPLQPAQGIGFAIPVNMAKTLLPRLRTTGAAPRAYLGVDAQPLDAALAVALGLPSPRGALLASVEKASPAEEAGIEPGDVILTWGAANIATSEDLKINAQLSIPGSQIRVGVFRDRKRIDRTITLRAAPGRATPAVHPSSCSLLGRETIRSEELVVIELPAERAVQLPGGRGVAISEVPPQSASADAGLRIGDVVLRVGKAKVRSAADVAAAVKQHQGEVIPVLLRRSGYDFWAAVRRH